MTKAAEAKANMIAGMNCAQAVAKAFADEAGIDPESMANLAFPFGGGFARQGLMCGALSGAEMVLGAVYGRQLGADPQYREKMYARAGELVERFRAQNGSCLCRELIGYDFSIPEQAAKARELGVTKDICPALAESAARILDEMVAEQKA